MTQSSLSVTDFSWDGVSEDELRERACELSNIQKIDILEQLAQSADPKDTQTACLWLRIIDPQMSKDDLETLGFTMAQLENQEVLRQLWDTAGRHFLNSRLMLLCGMSYQGCDLVREIIPNLFPSASPFMHAVAGMQTDLVKWWLETKNPGQDLVIKAAHNAILMNDTDMLAVLIPHLPPHSPDLMRRASNNGVGGVVAQMLVPLCPRKDLNEALGMSVRNGNQEVALMLLSHIHPKSIAEQMNVLDEIATRDAISGRVVAEFLKRDLSPKIIQKTLELCVSQKLVDVLPQALQVAQAYPRLKLEATQQAYQHAQRNPLYRESFEILKMCLQALDKAYWKEFILSHDLSKWPSLQNLNQVMLSYVELYDSATSSVDPDISQKETVKPRKM